MNTGVIEAGLNYDTGYLDSDGREWVQVNPHDLASILSVDPLSFELALDPVVSGPKVFRRYVNTCLPKCTLDFRIAPKPIDDPGDPDLLWEKNPDGWTFASFDYDHDAFVQARKEVPSDDGSTVEVTYPIIRIEVTNGTAKATYAENVYSLARDSATFPSPSNDSSDALPQQETGKEEVVDPTPGTPPEDVQP